MTSSTMAAEVAQGSVEEVVKASGEENPAASAQPQVNKETVPQLDAETLKTIAPKIAKVRSQVRENFGKIVMAMMMLPRYRNQTVADLQHLVLEPLTRDRIAIAYPAAKEEDQTRQDLADVSGMAIWASVSEEVDAKIREQVAAGTFPLRLKADEWNSGDIHWLLDVIAPNKKMTASVLANFKQVVKEGALRLHPVVTTLVDEETLKKMGAEKLSPADKKA